MPNLPMEQPWKDHDPYSLDIPKHSLYLSYEQMNTLHMLVRPSPSDLQIQMIQAYHEIRATGREPLLLIHAESMQTEKTKNMKLFAQTLQKQGKRVQYVIPHNGIGEELQRGDEPGTGFILSRAFPEERIEALVLLTSSLARVRAQLARRGITPVTTDIICIDEVQLCTNQTPLEAVAGLLELQRAGFTVVVNGIDYDFKSDPFSHMHHLLLMSRFLPGWRTFQLTTMCRHCPNPARGSRRVITFPDGRTQIADAASPIVMPGLSDYYAVCDVYHKSCTRLREREEHVRAPLPTQLPLEQISQFSWMRETLTFFQISLP